MTAEQILAVQSRIIDQSAGSWQRGLWGLTEQANTIAVLEVAYQLAVFNEREERREANEEIRNA